MKKLFALVVPLLFLTACPKAKEVQAMLDQLSARRAATIDVVTRGSYDLDNLLKAHEYFFDFSEKVHLLQVEPDAIKDLQKLIDKKGTKNFCEVFVLPMNYWETLNAYCVGGSLYLCSPEIQEYPNVHKKMMELLDPQTRNALMNEKNCN